MALFQLPTGSRFKYLQPSDLRRLERLMFAPRHVVEGRYAGQYATRQRGQSVEFQDYRPYLPGDEIGNVDWKVYGRTDRLVIKIFEHQTDLTVHLLIDASASMGYDGREAGRRPHSKYDYACFLAASIGFLISKQQDRFAAGFAQQGLKHYAPPDKTMPHLNSILKQMETVRPRREAGLAAAIHEINRTMRRRSLLILFSDLLDEPDQALKALAARMQLGGEAVLFQVLHPHEIDLPDIEQGLFIDAETGGRVRLNVPEVRAVYQDKMRAFLNRWETQSRALGIDYVRAMTSQPYPLVLERYLVGRGERVGGT